MKLEMYKKTAGVQYTQTQTKAEYSICKNITFMVTWNVPHI